MRGRFILSNCLFALSMTLSGCAATLRQQVYKPDDTMIDIAAWTQSLPQDIKVQTEDGLSLGGYYWPGAANDHDVIIFFHGRGSHQGVAAKYAEYLTGHGDHVLVASYRGFGGNPGSPTQAGLVRDGRAFVARAKTIAGPDAHIFLVGHSLGGAVALHVAATVPVTGVVTLSTFDKLEDAAPSYIGSLLPDKWNNLVAATKINAPWLLLHGSADTKVDSALARRLFVAARSPAALVMMAGATHSPQMQEIGPLVTQVVAAIDANDMMPFRPTLPKGWSIKRK